MKIDKIYNIKYVDAHYSYEPDLYTRGYYANKEDLNAQSTELHFLSAHGYTEKYNNNIIIAFIKKKGVPLRETIKNGEKIIKGLIIPDRALASNTHIYPHGVLKGIKLGSRVAVTWRDILYVANIARYDCSRMYTEGTLYKIEDDHIVLKDTETIRTNPTPIKNHPAGKPQWYTLPISFIESIEGIS